LTEVHARSTWQRVSALRNSGRYGTVGLELVFALAIGFFGGRALDAKYFGGQGYGTAVGILFALAVCVRALMRASKEMQSDIDREEREAFPYEREYLEQAEKTSARTQKDGERDD
jgi:hypothetical protein